MSLDINKQEHRDPILVINKERSICLGRFETQLLKLIAESRVPSPRSLFKNIKSYVKLANYSRVFRILITRRLPHINIFFKKIMKESILNIPLVKTPIVGKCKG
jgi:hypothetical protein